MTQELPVEIVSDGRG